MSAKTQDGMKLKDGLYCKNSFASLSYFLLLKNVNDKFECFNC